MFSLASISPVIFQPFNTSVSVLSLQILEAMPVTIDTLKQVSVFEIKVLCTSVSEILLEYTVLLKKLSQV